MEPSRNHITFLTIIVMILILMGCSDNKPITYENENKDLTDTISYLDFKFSKVIAFATVDPFDPNYLYGVKKMDLSKFGDTISRTLDSTQLKLLVSILNGRSEKDADSLEADCHNPRHNIAFLNNRNNVLHYISVCFECRTIISTKPHKGSFKGFELFFNSIGLKVFDEADHYRTYYDSLNNSRQPRFDSQKFTHLADSLLKSINSKTTTVTCSFDTLHLRKNEAVGVFRHLLSDDKVVLSRYFLNPGKGNAWLSFRIVHAQYPDSITANKAYAAISKDASENAAGENNSPGLTYTNDYVIKNSKHIYWLNTACTYASFNHRKLQSFLLRSLTLKNITDSIHCDCGAPTCEVNGLKPKR